MTLPVIEPLQDEASRDIPLFADRQKVYPRTVKGPLRRDRKSVV